MNTNQASQTVTVEETTLTLPTYREPACEALPMFAENRVHQRSSGNPYPNRVVLDVDRTHREDRPYRCVRLENEYLRIELLPELGGRKRLEAMGMAVHTLCEFEGL